MKSIVESKTELENRARELYRRVSDHIQRNGSDDMRHDMKVRLSVLKHVLRTHDHTYLTNVDIRNTTKCLDECESLLNRDV